MDLLALDQAASHPDRQCDPAGERQLAHMVETASTAANHPTRVAKLVRLMWSYPVFSV